MILQCDKVHCHDAESWLVSHEHLFSAFLQEYHVIHVDILSVLQAKLLIDGRQQIIKDCGKESLCDKPAKTTGCYIMTMHVVTLSSQ